MQKISLSKMPTNGSLNDLDSLKCAQTTNSASSLEQIPQYKEQKFNMFQKNTQNLIVYCQKLQKQNQKLRLQEDSWLQGLNKLSDQRFAKKIAQKIQLLAEVEILKRAQISQNNYIQKLQANLNHLGRKYKQRSSDSMSMTKQFKQFQPFPERFDQAGLGHLQLKKNSYSLTPELGTKMMKQNSNRKNQQLKIVQKQLIQRILELQEFNKNQPLPAKIGQVKNFRKRQNQNEQIQRITRIQNQKNKQNPPFEKSKSSAKLFYNFNKNK